MARIFKPSAKKSLTNKESTPERLEILRLSEEGRGIAKHQGKTVFVQGALTGEEVTVKHYRRRSKYSECQLKSVLRASVDRQVPPCPIYAECGGCQLQHLRPQKQLEHKQASLINNITHQLKQRDFQVLAPALSSHTEYRSRVRFVVNGHQQLCFRAQGSDKLVVIKSCLVLEPRVQSVMSALQQWLLNLPLRSGVSHVEITAGEDAVGVIIRHLKPLTAAAIEGLNELQQTAGCHCWLQPEKHGELMDLKGQTCSPRLRYALGDVTMAFHPRDFTQVNRQINQTMIEQALLWLQPEGSDCIVDLFCGIGNFTLPLAQQCARVIGVEAVDNMVERGRENALMNGINNVEFKALDLNNLNIGQQLSDLGADKLLMDPPRAGAKFVCENLSPNVVSKVVYVSCNPASLARDTAILQERGYTLRALRALDMFPHTAHVEAMVLFES